MSWLLVPALQENLKRKSMFRKSYYERRKDTSELESSFTAAPSCYSSRFVLDKPDKWIIDFILSPLEIAAGLSVLEDAVDELSVLGSTIDKPLTEPNLLCESLNERMTKKKVPKIIDVQSDRPTEVVKKNIKEAKFQKDRGFLEKILFNTVRELKVNGTYAVLANAVAQVYLEDSEEFDFLYDSEMNEDYLKKLKRDLKNHEMERQDRIYDIDEQLTKYKDEIQDVIFQSDLQLHYTDHWERSQYEQLEHTLQCEEQDLKDKIFELKAKKDLEYRVNAENETFIEESESKLEDGIVEWFERYEREIEEKDIEIQVLNEKRTMNLNNLENLSLIFQKHKEELNQYKEIKLKELQDKELEQKRTRAAVIIQAWWKGAMVRRQLGRYARKKRKGKRGNGRRKVRNQEKVFKKSKK